MKSLVKRFMLLALIVLGAAGVWAQTNNTIDLSTVTSDITVNNGYTLTGTLGANVQISIANGATVTLNNVTINGVDNSSYNWAGITCNGNATIILVGENTVKGFYSYRSGIYVPENSTLTIQGSGSLTASSNGNGAGIGGYKGSSCGNINIAGGTIIANGGYLCPGIGGSGSNINISDGMVTATGGTSAPGIGGQQGGSCGNINITGGMVTATGGTSAPGIGGGQGAGCGTITIANTVTGIRAVKGGGSSPAPHSIGAGYGGSCGTVTVNGISSNGISTNPYSYPSYILTDIPNGWSVNADNINVTVTNGEASIPVGADVVLTPPSADKPRVKNVELLSPEQVPLTFEAKTTDGATVTFNINTAAATNTVQYSTDGNTWNDYTSGDEIPLNNIGDKVSFRGNNEAYAYSSESDVSYFSCSADCYVYGNVMSLIDAEHYPDSTGLPSGHTFCSLFNNNSYIYNHPTKTLVLPATTLKEYCYAGMFKGCTNLTTAPALPATEMAELCYLHMFDGCISLTMAPELPATTLASQCYSNMFQGCTSLETAPALPATTLAGSCYNNMFNGCSNLQTAPQLLATTLASGCYEAMFYNCTSLTTAPALPATNLVTSCYSAMFHGCTSLATAPVLPATALESNCYFEMFSGCSNLNSATCLATPNTSDTYEWLKDVAETGTFIKSAAVTGWLIDDPSGIPEGWTVKDHETFLPLTFEAKEANATVTFTKASSSSLSSLSVEYSTDGTTWTTYTEPILLTKVGDKVSFRGNNAKYAKDPFSYSSSYSNFSCIKSCYVYGNIMSLIDADDYPTMTVLTSDNDYAFCDLFRNNTMIYNHPSKTLVLPATTLANNCYNKMFYNCSNLTSAPALLATTLADWCCYQMFYGCSSLSSAPALPATTLAQNCYANMFEDCSNLTSAPELPATTLASSCYYGMFKGCSNLTSAPALPATTLASSCYGQMFQNCTSLSSAPALPATTLASSCYLQMFQNCISLSSAPALPATTLASSCYLQMFQNCISLSSAPALPATTLANCCYQSMFQDCSNLTSAPELPATTLANYCYQSMFQGCSNLISAPALLPATTLVSSCYESMFQGCSNLTSAPALPATTLAGSCYYGMFQGCSNLTSAPALPATTLASSCYRQMFRYCTSLSSAPALPATTLAGSCYNSMFEYCSNLNSVTCLATNISAYNCTANWLFGVASTGTFTKASGIAAGGYGWPLSPSGIPQGWTVDDYYDPLATPLTFEAKTADAVVRFTRGSAVTWTNTVEYSLNGGAWTTYTSGTSITLTNVGDKVSFRGNNAKYAISMSDNGTEHSKFSCTQNCYVYGNIMSLIDADDYPTMTVLTSDNSFAFCNLFTGNTNIYNHPSKTLVLPATTLAYRCYGRMFYYCSNLTSAPALLATTLAEECCYQMFYHCSSLTSAPALPATTLAQSCYYNMFYYCSNLTSAPALPATTLAQSCYALMFEGCSNLTSAPALPATTLASSCYYGMFQGCSNLTSAPALPATTLASSCYRQMFQNCTSLSSAPALPATTLASYCYYDMFRGCSNLNSVTCLATNISANYCTSYWLSGVAATGTFNKASGIAAGGYGWPRSTSGIPQGWTVVNEGALPGEFTVNASGEKVRFSQGNLQATTSDLGANWSWAFAANQWDYIGNAVANTSINGNGTVSANGTVDLFGWVGASSTWTGAAQYGISNSTTTNSKDTYGNVASEALKSDWGNTIGTGWRTLTTEEWQYLFSNHTNGWSTVNGVGGYVIRPDGVSTAVASSYTASEWATQEAAGAVFLPAAGRRINGAMVSSGGYNGLYWSSSSHTSDANYAHCINFISNNLYVDNYYRYYGLSVRLVRDAN